MSPQHVVSKPPMQDEHDRLLSCHDPPEPLTAMGAMEPFAATGSLEPFAATAKAAGMLTATVANTSVRASHPFTVSIGPSFTLLACAETERLGTPPTPGSHRPEVNTITRDGPHLRGVRPFGYASSYLFGFAEPDSSRYPAQPAGFLKTDRELIGGEQGRQDRKPYNLTANSDDCLAGGANQERDRRTPTPGT